MSYVYCTYLSCVDVVAPMGAAARHMCEGRLLLVSIIRVCAFSAAVSAVTVGSAVIWDERVRRLCTSAPWLGVLASCRAWTLSMRVCICDSIVALD